MLWALLVPATIGAVAVSGGILLAIVFEPTRDASVETKKVLSAIVASGTAFATAAFVKDFDDVDTKMISPILRGEFNRAFHGRFKSGSRAQLAVYSEAWEGHEGWGLKASLARARVIQETLAR